MIDVKTFAFNTINQMASVVERFDQRAVDQDDREDHVELVDTVNLSYPGGRSLPTGTAEFEDGWVVAMEMKEPGRSYSVTTEDSQRRFEFQAGDKTYYTTFDTDAKMITGGGLV